MQHKIKIFLKIFAVSRVGQYGKESKTSATETAGDGSWQIQASAEIRRVSELLTMATNGRRTKSSNTTV